MTEEQELDIKKLAQEQERTHSLSDVTPTDKVSMQDIDISIQSRNSIETEELDYSSKEESISKIIRDNVENKQLNDSWEDQKSLSLQSSPPAETISQLPEYQDTPTREVIASAPDDFNPDNFPSNIGGAKMPGSVSLQRHRAGISRHGMGGDFKDSPYGFG